MRFPRAVPAVECSGHERTVLDRRNVATKRGAVVLVGMLRARKTERSAHAVLHAVLHRYVALRRGAAVGRGNWRGPRRSSATAVSGERGGAPLRHMSIASRCSQPRHTNSDRGAALCRCAARTSLVSARRTRRGPRWGSDASHTLLLYSSPASDHPGHRSLPSTSLYWAQRRTSGSRCRANSTRPAWVAGCNAGVGARTVSLAMMPPSLINAFVASSPHCLFS